MYIHNGPTYLRNLSYKWPDATEKMLIVSLVEIGSSPVYFFFGGLSPKNLSTSVKASVTVRNVQYTKSPHL